LALLAMPYSELPADAAGHRVAENGYFTGLAEHMAAGWRFRDAHWADSGPPTVVQ
jgi:hypothetical protein